MYFPACCLVPFPKIFPRMPPAEYHNPEEGSVSRVIRQMKDGDASNADLIWERFFDRICFLVRDRLHSQLKAVADEEDVALQSLLELFRGLLDGNYPDLNDRDSLWRLLVTVSSRNVIDQVKSESRQKRGSGRVVHESSFQDTESASALFEGLPSNAITPDVQLMITERCAQMLESLQDEQLQAIAVMKTAGSGNQEIAGALQISLRSVERRLAQIRTIWDADESPA